MLRIKIGGVGVLTVEYVEKVYNRQANIYDLLFGRVFPGRERASELLKLFPGAELLEVGVGTGLNLPILPENIDITGIDLSQKMLAKAHKRVAKHGLENVELIRMDATRLDFPDNRFDRVLAAFIVSVVPEPVQLIEEMKRVCRPGGYILMVNHFLSEHPLKAFFERLASPLCYHIGFNTDLDLRKLIRDAQLDVDFEEDSDAVGHWKAVRFINHKI